MKEKIELNGEAVNLRKQFEKQELNVEDVVKIEQDFGISRQAILWRLVNDGYLSPTKADTMKTGLMNYV